MQELLTGTPSGMDSTKYNARIHRRFLCLDDLGKSGEA